MERNNGYLDLNKYYEEVAGTSDRKQLEKELYITPSHYTKDHYFLDIDGEVFYFKDSNFGYRECMAHYIAKDMGLDSLFYDLAEFGVYRGVISKCFHNDSKEYFTIADILDYYKDNDFKSINEYTGKVHIKDACAEINSLDVIWQALEYRFPESKDDVPKVMNDLVDAVMFKFLIGNSDAYAYNFEIEYDQGHIKLCPIFDNEYSFWPEHGEFALTALYGGNHDFYSTLRDFLSVSDEIYTTRFKELFKRFNEDYFYDIMHTVEVNHGYKFKEAEKERIIKFYHVIKEVVETVFNELNIEYTGRKNG